MRFFTTALPLAVLLLSPIAASSQAPSTPAKAPQFKWHIIVLQHTKPNDVLKILNWSDTANGKASPRLPDGIARIYTQQGSAFLLIAALDDAYPSVKSILTNLDAAPQRVRLKLVFTALPISQETDVDISHPIQALAHLRQSNADFYNPLPISTSSGGSFYFDLAWRPFSRSPADYATNTDALPGISREGAVLHFTPHINRDNSVTMTLDFERPKQIGWPKLPDQVNQVLTTPVTASSGGTLVYDLSSLPGYGRYRVFRFLTPMVLKLGDTFVPPAALQVIGNAGTMNGKP